MSKDVNANKQYTTNIFQKLTCMLTTWIIITSILLSYWSVGHHSVLEDTRKHMDED